LRAKFIHALGSLGKHLEACDRFDEAIVWYLKGLDADVIVEPFHQGLMRCYAKLDRNTEAIGAYRRLRQTLSVTLGLRPSASTERIYQSLRAG
jgi:DNA-binding SARP family transcriptional activator